MKTHPRLPVPAFVSLAAALILSSRALAQITVTTAADEINAPAGAQVSLREALRDSANGGQITFDAALNGKVLVLTAGEMAVAGKTLTVSAPGGLVIEARGLSRIFRVAAGGGLNLTGVTLQGGRAPADGGAILNAGTLSLTDGVLRDNRAAHGASGASGSPRQPKGTPGGPGGAGGHGGAVSSTGGLTALRCHFTGNSAGAGGSGGRGGAAEYHPLGSWDGGDGGNAGPSGAGGAIFDAGPLRLTECVFESNRAGQGGSGGWVGSSALNAINGNGSAAGSGGAVRQSGDMTLERCTFSGNVCQSGGLAEGPFSWGFPGSRGSGGSGAAVYWNAGTATLTNCTVTNNSAGEGRDPSAEFGGAVAAGGGTLLRLVHCTVAGNLAVRFYGDNSGVTSTAAGIVSTAPVQCHNCILSGNMRNRTGTSASPVWEEVNISPNTPRTVIPFGPLGGTPGTDAQLGPLVLTSGPLPVLVPRATSPALNAGAIISSPPATDQRGLPRAAGIPDLGAVEVQPAETSPRLLQSITFEPPLSAQSSVLSLSATASSGLPVSFELVSGPATLNGNTLTFTGAGFVGLRASQAGGATTAPALSVVRVIEAPHVILFTPAYNYPVYPQSQTVVTLPATTSAGLPVTWSFNGTPGPWVSLSGNQVTATGAGSVGIRGESDGNAQYAPVDSTWTLTFVPGSLWWDTPPAPWGGPHWFTLVEGSPYGLSMTARIAAPHSGPVTVPVLPDGLIATPSVIPAGQTSVQCLINLPANASLINHSREIATGNPASNTITLFLANRRNVPLDVFAPARVFAGISTQVDISSPGVPAGASYGPPPDLSLRSVNVTAVDFDNPATSIPITLDSTTSDVGPYPKKHLQITFPPMNRRARLTVTTDDGITGQSGPVQIVADTNADGDGINDLVEAALQRAPDQFHPPPLTIERDGTRQHAVLGSRPLDLKGWTVVTELSTDLQTWTPAPSGSTTATPNPDGTTERVSVLLPTAATRHYVRLRVSVP